MTQTLTKYERYLADFRALERAQAEDPAWLRDLRGQALDRFSELGMPTARRGNEKWKYTNVGPIAQADFGLAADVTGNGVAQSDVARVAPWQEDWTNLVFLDGRYSAALSTPMSDGLQVASLADALRTNEEAVKSHLAHYASVDDDGFTALNTAFLGDGAFVLVPEGKRMERPINLVFVSTAHGEPTVSYPRVLVVAERESQATVIESYVGLSDGSYFTNAVAEMVVGDGAEVDHYRLLSESDQAFHIGGARVRLGDNSRFTSSIFERKVGLGRYDLYVLMDGPGSSCTLNGLYMTSGTQHVDNYINVDHVKPYATSRLLYKGILDGKSRAVFGGTVWVREGAIKTDSMQSDKNLVLSPDAEIDSKPALFIYADDVKCGHGATAGNIDQDTVFYMRSRGVDLETASRLLIYGFASEIIDTVQVDDLRTYLERIFLESLPTYTFEF